MKKVFIKSLSVFALFIALNNAATAGDKAPFTEFKSVGTMNRQPVFELAIQQTSAQQVTIVVRDEFGLVLHEEMVTGSSFTRRFMLNAAELGRTAVSFEVYNATGVLTATYKVRNHQLVK